MATKREWDSVINHWTRLANGKQRKGEGIGCDDCAFCRRYFCGECCGCPIYEKTGEKRCVDTPYTYVEAIYYEHPIGMDKPEFRAAAKKELEWLKKLRKEVRGD